MHRCVCVCVCRIWWIVSNIKLDLTFSHVLKHILRWHFTSLQKHQKNISVAEKVHQIMWRWVRGQRSITNISRRHSIIHVSRELCYYSLDKWCTSQKLLLSRIFQDGKMIFQQPKCYSSEDWGYLNLCDSARDGIKILFTISCYPSLICKKHQ